MTTNEESQGDHSEHAFAGGGCFTTHSGNGIFFPSSFGGLLEALKLQVSIRCSAPLDILPQWITPQSPTSISHRDKEVVHLGQSRQSWSPLLKKGCG